MTRSSNLTPRRRPLSRRHRAASSDVDTPPVMRLWALRILVPLGGHRRLEAAIMCNPGVTPLLGIPEPGLEPDAQIRNRLKRRLDTLERLPRPATVLDHNVALLGDALGLSALDRDLLLLIYLLHTNAAFEEIADTLGALDRATLITVLQTVLGYPRPDVERALHEDRGVIGAGLIRLDNRSFPLKGKFDILTGLLDALADRQSDPLTLLRRFFAAAPAPELAPSDFESCRTDYELLSRYLRRALPGGRRGVNVLVYGPPGSGKTQLVRTLAADLGCDLFEVAIHNGGQMPLDATDRLQALQLAQRVLAARGNALLVFDELEDVFPENGELAFFQDSGVHRRKAWINQLLENGPVPTFWVGNAIGQLDPAYRRRFDFVLEIQQPSEALRRRMIAGQLAGLTLEAGFVETLARHPSLTPGVVQRVATVVATMEPANACDAQNAFEQVAGNLLKAMDAPPLVPPQPAGELPYQRDLINAAMDPAAVAAGLARHPSGRLLCYGPPGTGKTAFARHVAEQLGRPLVTGRASDVLNMYVGGTEQRIRALFAEARAQGAVLLLDEIDGLLRTRDRAERSWELTQVNELLVQIEAFPGVLIACTNLLETLDPAALRRFDLKVRFDYLRPAQAWGLVEHVLADRGVALDVDAVRARARLTQLTVLTPGDFAAVLRRFRFSGEPLNATSLVEALVNECGYKAEKPRRGIGFVANL